MSEPSAIPEIILLVNPDESTSISGQRGWGEDIRQRVSSLVEVRIEPAKLEHQMTGFLKMVRGLFQQAEEEVEKQSGMQLSEVELTVEISTKGEVKLVAGGELGGKGAIKLKFTRVKK